METDTPNLLNKNNKSPKSRIVIKKPIEPANKSNGDDMAVKYRDSYMRLFDNLAVWKKHAIQESLKLKRVDDSLLNDFIQSVIMDAEQTSKKAVSVSSEETEI